MHRPILTLAAVAASLTLSAAPGDKTVPLAGAVDPARPFVATPYDAAGNPGIPHLIIPSEEKKK